MLQSGSNGNFDMSKAPTKKLDNDSNKNSNEGPTTTLVIVPTKVRPGLVKV